jgi:type I restriction enzyme M protein
MADYLQQIEDAKVEVARLKGEKEAFEQSNPPDDADEEELAKWNYAKDLDRQIKELRADHRDDIKALAKLERAAAKKNAKDSDQRAADKARAALQPVFDQIAALEAELAPYEQIKVYLAAARARYRELTSAFVDELKNRCAALTADEKQALVLELFAQDLQAGQDAAVNEKRQTLTRFIESLWAKYATSLTQLTQNRERLTSEVSDAFQELGYVE